MGDSRRRSWPLDILVDRLLLATGVLVSGALAFPELLNRVPDLNDNVLHRGIIARMAESMASGRDPTDPWLPSWVLGSAMLHFYPFLGHLIAAVPVALFPHAITALDSLRGATWLLLTLLPWSMYVMMRSWPAARPGPGAVALATPLVAEAGLYGLGVDNYTWAGHGLYPQLWGAVLGPLAVAAGLSALRRGERTLTAGILLGGTWLCHPLLGYLAAGTLVLAALLEWQVASWRRLVFLSAVASGVAAPLLAPLFLDRAYTGFSVWDEPWRRDSWGWSFVLGRLAGGRLLDDGRAPVLGLLTAAGFLAAVAALVARRGPLTGPAGPGPRRAAGLLMASFGLWTAAFVGRAGLGRIVDLLPMGSRLHLHRMILGVQWTLLGFLGFAVGAVWQRLGVSRSRSRTAVAVLLLAALFLPALRERMGWLERSRLWTEQTRGALAAEPGLARIIDTLRELPPGRVFAGPVNGWGGAFKVGFVPVHAVLSDAGFDVVSYLYTYSPAADVMPVFDPSRPAHYQALNVRYVVSDTGWEAPFLDLVLTEGRFRLWRMRGVGYWGVVDAVDLWRVPEDVRIREPQAPLRAATDVSLAWMRSGSPERGAYILLQPPRGEAPEPGDLTQPAEEGDPPGRVLAERIDPFAYGATVTLDRDGFVVLRSAYDPHWRATMDGGRARTYFVTPGFVAIRAPAGNHEVEFTYGYARWRWFFVSAATVVLGLVFRRRVAGGAVAA